VNTNYQKGELDGLVKKQARSRNALPKGNEAPTDVLGHGPR
jgi:hypothetical protein